MFQRKFFFYRQHTVQPVSRRQLLLKRRPDSSDRRVPCRLLLLWRRSFLHHLPRRQPLLDRGPVRSNWKLLRRLLLLRRRRFRILHRLSRGQLLPALCYASSNTVSPRQLLPIGKAHGSHALHPGHVLCWYRPHCCIGQLCSRILQQRWRCDVSVHAMS